MVRWSQTSKLLMPLLFSLQGLNALAADSNPQIVNKHLLPNAVQVQVTPRGMKYFDTRLSELLGNLGVKLDEGYFPAMKFTFDKPIRVEDYATTNPEAVAMYKQVRDMLTQWLVGFSMNDHLPTVEIGESGYIAQFSRFALVTDEALMNSIGKREGAVLAVELEVKQLTVSTNSVMVWDLNNEFLGKAGFEKVTLVAGNQQTPIKIRIPFYVRMNSVSGLDFEALEVSNNIDKTALTMKYEKLIIPTFAVEINGKKFYLNNQEIDKLFNAQAPKILELIRDNLGLLAKKQLPELLNQKAREFLGGSLEQVMDMAAPGKEATDRRPDFKWGIKLQNINLKKSLNIDLTAFVEDPLNQQSIPLKTNNSRGAPAVNALPQENYDLALTIDRALINRILQLSYERKNFSQIKQSDGTIMKIMSAPTVDYVKTPAGAALKPQEAYLKLRVSIENKPNSTWLKDTIVLDFDIIAKLRQLSDKSGMQLVLMNIDTDSLYLADKYFSFLGSIVKGKVRDGVKDKLREIAAGWSKREEAIPGSLPLPPEVLGIKLDINRVVMDPNGHLVMYLDYAKTGVK